jgi:hypothetical protein
MGNNGIFFIFLLQFRPQKNKTGFETGFETGSFNGTEHFCILLDNRGRHIKGVAIFSAA